MHRSDGRIEVICGCMFAGKTAELIARLEAARADGLRIAAFKHASDKRYGIHVLATHDQRSFAASAVDDAALVADGSRDADVVGVDEVQFFGRGIVEVCRKLAEDGLRVIVAGIDHDAWGRPFLPLPQLKEIADEVIERHMPCTVCGRPAPYTQRMVPVGEQDMVGGPAEYEPRCAECFQSLPPPAPTY